ncbi:MAG: CotH kinase family protein [Lachnospiraceae bacterium]|nr:CotH kinase family protein [Lachnospiraceae bacterium]
MNKLTKKIGAITVASIIVVSEMGTFVPLANAYAAENSVSLDSLVAPKKAFLYNFVDAGKGYEVVFTDSNDYSTVTGATISYELYVNNSSNPVATVSSTESFISASVIDSLNLTNGRQYNFSLKTVADWSDGTRTVSPASSASTFYYTENTSTYDTGVSKVIINTSRDSSTESIDLYTDTSKTKVGSAITVINDKTGKVEANDFGTVNVRGNSTSLAQKKPYNFKFNSKKNLFGMGKAKKWSLLANIFDKTLIRNQIGLDFQRSLEESRNIGQVYTSDCIPVDLYVDGRYLGNYLLVESVETGSTRVDIDDSYVDDNDDVAEGVLPKQVTIAGTTYNTYDVLLELANDVKDIQSRYDDESYYFKTSRLNEYFATNSPERTNESYGLYVWDSNKPAWLNDTKAFLEGFESVLTGNYTDAQTQYDLLAQFIDIDSFVDFYITSEFFMTKDINFSSTRFYIKNGKLYGGPLWDLDLSSGNSNEHTGYTDFYAQDMAWFGRLMNNRVFASKVKERYQQLQPQIQALYHDNGVVDSLVDEIRGSVNANYSKAYNAQDYTGWKLTTNYGAYNSPVIYSTYDAYVDEYKTWLENRNEWLCTQWNIDMNSTLESGIELNGFQISNTVGGLRTVYSVEDYINDKKVTEVGLVYGLANYTTENNMTVGNNDPYVKSFKATSVGKVSTHFSDSLSATSYAMTMKFAVGNAAEFSEDMYVRGYAKLSSGEYVYTDVSRYSVYNIADYLYQNKKMNRVDAHEYVYNNILKIVNPDYAVVDYTWSDELAP